MFNSTMRPVFQIYIMILTNNTIDIVNCNYKKSHKLSFK